MKSDNPLLKEMESRLKKDDSFEQGRIMGSMCSAPDPLGAEVFRRCLEKNAGDPGLFPETARLEQEVIEELSRWTGLNPAAHSSSAAHSPGGTFTSGGTEANILAMWAAREQAPPGAREVILPESAHFSFDKAAAMLGLKLVKIPLLADGRADTEALERALSPHTAALVGIAGTTGLGAIDDLTRFSEIALREGIYLHVDAAFGGFILPFLENPLPFDFRLPGVRSLTMDPHKMGRAPIPAGVLLFRRKADQKAVLRPVSYLAGGQTRQTTILGTRPGASVCAVWALLRHHGHPGYQAITREAMAKTREALSCQEAIPGLERMINPPLNVLGLYSPRLALGDMASRLRGRGWKVSLFSNFIRIVLMPHVTLEMIHTFFTDIEEVLIHGD